MNQNKYLLLDIDNTLFCENTPRPYLKDFLDRMSAKYGLRFYTSATRERVYQVTSIMHSELGIVEPYIYDLRLSGFNRDNCPLKELITPNGVIQYKDLVYVVQCLFTSVRNVLLIDDAPMHDNPNPEQRMQIPGWDGDENDTVLRDLQVDF